MEHFARVISPTFSSFAFSLIGRILTNFVIFMLQFEYSKTADELILNVYHLAAHMFYDTPFVVHSLHGHWNDPDHLRSVLFHIAAGAETRLEHMGRSVGKFWIRVEFLCADLRSN